MLQKNHFIKNCSLSNAIFKNLNIFLAIWLVCSLLPSASGYENAVIRGEARQQGRTRDKTYFPIHPAAAAPKVRARGRRSSKHFSSSRHRWTTLREPAPESASDRRCTTRWKAPHKEKLAKRISREMDSEQSMHLQR